MVKTTLITSRITLFALAFLSVFFLSFFSSAPDSKAQLTVDINRGVVEPIAIAIPRITGFDDTSNKLGRFMGKIIAANLNRSGLFKVIDSDAYLEESIPVDRAPQFQEWRQIEATALVSGDITPNQKGLVTISFRLWDTYLEKQITGKEFTSDKKGWRRIAHIISDEIYRHFTGDDAYFDSRVVYVAESGPSKRRIKRLAIMDQDGANHRFLTDGIYLSLTPRFSPNAKEILYLSYSKIMPRVHLRDLQTGREKLIGSFDGMSFAPRFSPDGKKIIMSIANNGVTDIYEMNLVSKRMKRLTASSAIDTSPCYSPDGKWITFNSDRSGSQQLYVMNSSGGNVRRISYGSGNYATPVWSPRGDYIAFTKMRKGVFHIGVMRSDGNGERLLTSSYLDEGPSWSSNGRVIIFTRQQRPGWTGETKSSIYSIDVTGYNLRKLPTPTGASDPSWSRLLPL